MSAFYAQKSLNGHCASEYGIRLEVVWYNSIEEDLDESEKTLLSDLVEASLKDPTTPQINSAGINSPSPVKFLAFH